MTEELSTTAIKALQIHDVVITEQSVSVNPKYLQLFFPDVNLRVKVNSAVSHDVIEHSVGDSDPTDYLVYRFRGQVLMFDPPLSDADVEVAPEHVFSDVSVIFSAYYKVVAKDKLNDDFLKEFGSKNVGYHVWPYFRHFVSSTLVDYRLPLITIPFYKVPDRGPES